MSRYALFIGMQFYPQGGWKDWRGSFDDPQEAAETGRAVMDRYVNDWWHVIDLKTGMMMAQGEAND